MKILIVEDQQTLANLLKTGFKKEGITADVVSDGESAQKRIEMHYKDYDLILLDLMLPKKSGLEVCKNVREFNITTPIIVLTAKDSTQDKINLLNYGADDYIIKPFSFGELIARIKAVMRRPKSSYVSEITTGNLHLNPQTRKVFFNGEELHLTLKEFSMLEYFIQHPNQAVSREDILANNWDFNMDSFNNVVDVYINKLRKKLAAKGGKNVIETVRGIGYRLRA